MSTASPGPVKFEPADTVESRNLDSDMVLFNRNGGRIYVLNETAAFVWQGLKHGLACSDIAEAISLQAGHDSDRILADCLSLIENWTAAGLGAGDARPVESNGVSEPEPGSVAKLTAADADDIAAWQAACREADQRRHYHIADLHLIIEAPGEAFGLIDGLLDHLAIPGDPVGDATGERLTKSDPATLTIARTDGRWTLFVEDIRFGGCDDDSKLAPMIHATVLHLSYAASKSMVSIHGAAVFSGERCVLFPGQPGAGKSTLTAALVEAGFGYCTDDFILLDGRPLKLRGIPLCIGLKEGAWPLLERSIPAIASLATRLREDGQLVRYLAPSTEHIATRDQHFRATAIVFPRVTPNEPCRLELLSRSAALLRIADAGYHLLSDLDVAAFEELLAWLRSLTCYELSFSAFDEAIAHVSELINHEAGSPSSARSSSIAE